MPPPPIPNRVKMTKNGDADNYFYSGYGIWFHTRETFSLSDGNGFGKNVIIFGVDHISFVFAYNRKGHMNAW